ncbi:hypothetical protein AAG570_008955 [Ranatra chinensis]|uniref:DUF4776 domain-containing protein n=1 Tax=Ranatra chinensis TaxID=642074 RepID=A0ABD0ZDJ4_9HEMI
MCDEYPVCGRKEPAGGSVKDEQLYLLEVLVDKINVKKEKRKPGKYKVKVHFWDFPPIEIDECEFRSAETPPQPPPQKQAPCIRPIKKPKQPPQGPPPPELVDPADLTDAPPDECQCDLATTGRLQEPTSQTSKQSTKKDTDVEEETGLSDAAELIDPYDLPQPESKQKSRDEQPLPIKAPEPEKPFSSGKSCLFPMVPIDLIRGIQRSPVSVYIFKQEEGEQPAIVGAVKVQLGDAFAEAITLASTPVVLPVSAHVEETFKIWDLFGGEVGNILMFIRLSCFGASVFSKFSSAGSSELYPPVGAREEEPRGSKRLCPLLTAEENLTVTTMDTLDDRENVFRTPVAWSKNGPFATESPAARPGKRAGRKQARQEEQQQFFGPERGPANTNRLRKCTCPPTLPRLLGPGPTPCPRPPGYLPCECAQILLALKSQVDTGPTSTPPTPGKPKKSRRKDPDDLTDQRLKSEGAKDKSQPAKSKSPQSKPKDSNSRPMAKEKEPKDSPADGATRDTAIDKRSKRKRKEKAGRRNGEKLVAPVPIVLPPLPTGGGDSRQESVVPTSKVCGAELKKSAMAQPVRSGGMGGEGDGGGDGPAVASVGSRRSDRSPDQDRPPKHGSRTRTIYEYTAGMYPGMHVGHKCCTTSFRFVPKSMGWLWNCPSPDDVFHPKRGWRPGAINKQVAELIRAWRKAAGLEVANMEVPAPVRKRKKRGAQEAQALGGGGSTQDHEDRPEIERLDPVKPTLHVHKREGFYYVSMFPTRENDDAPSPRPIQFKIDAKKGTTGEGDDDDSDSDSDDDSSNSSESSDDSLEIEFVAPAALKRRPRAVMKANMETQYDPADFTPKKEKTKADSKGGKKGKDKKGKKGKKGKKK